ncbi:hypothetical protein Clacol_004821 [Clathrus columnatus]|uniref:AB hydrolase-1 domain-containing protein n=1 Tax=Clathrus columnatus TaxID=1419009 RepID=A0AAV5ABK5_9AGAM|nr:hypothetical protein Clacol_004821 [Clathrus columnatus]
MPTLEVKPGISLFYLDSGAPGDPLANDTQQQAYITLFMLHGHSFHSPIFNRAIAVAHKYNIRFVAITRRDYHGSSLLTSEDIKAVTHGSTEQRIQTFTERAGEIMEFIKEFIDKNNIPPNSGTGGGGFSLSGWSLGNLQGFSVLAFGNRFPDLVEKLTPYFRSYISYETTVVFTPPIDVYHPLADESVPKEERGTYFCHWISSYFDHPPEGIATGDPTLLNQTTPSTTKPSSYSQFTDEEREAIIDNKPSLRADIFFFRIDPQVNTDILRHAFTQQDDSPAPPAWPNVPARSLWCSETAWSVIFSLRETERWVVRINEENKGRWVRPYDSICVEGGNHFLHWDEPDKFLEKTKELMML